MYVYLETHSNSPQYNLAFEEYCLKNLCHYPQIMLLWQNKNAVIIGRYQNALSEINSLEAERLGIDLVRRTTGGGAVYHDLGNLNYSFISKADSLAAIDLEVAAAPLLQALNKMGIEAKVEGRNDIVLAGSKISGTAQRLYKNRLLHHGTLLYDTDLRVLEKVLTVDPTKLKAKGVKSVRSRVGNIKDILTRDQSTFEFWQDLLLALPAMEKIEMTSRQLAEISDLAQSKYASWEWNHGNNPTFTFSNSKRFPAGKIEIGLQIEKGIIKASRISGDFLGLIPIAGLEKALLGLKYDRALLAAALLEQPLHLHLGNISQEEFLSCIFPE